MDYELLYSAFTIAIAVFWLLLLVAPGWIWTDRIVHSAFTPWRWACG